jgi:hypothetical protein
MGSPKPCHTRHPGTLIFKIRDPCFPEGHGSVGREGHGSVAHGGDFWLGAAPYKFVGGILASARLLYVPIIGKPPLSQIQLSKLE